MEISSEEVEIPMPMPINRVYGHGDNAPQHQGHMIHHHQHQHQHRHHDHHNEDDEQDDDEEDPPPSSSSPPHNNIIPSSSSTKIPILSINNNGNGSALNLEGQQQQGVPYNNNEKDSEYPISKKKVMVRYRECQKNHAASMGGNATDGCGEFMASGEEGTLQALICSACNCHRNFHRKETVSESPTSHHFYLPTPHHVLGGGGRKVILGSGSGSGGPGFLGYPNGVRTTMAMNMPYQVGPTIATLNHDHDHLQHGHGHGHMMITPSNNYQLVKKRFRTKFSQEQKQKMLEFAEKVGWKIQRQEEDVVQQFCQEVGVRRKVLKVWMHNNKHNFAKKSSSKDSPLLD